MEQLCISRFGAPPFKTVPRENVDDKILKGKGLGYVFGKLFGLTPTDPLFVDNDNKMCDRCFHIREIT